MIPASFDYEAPSTVAEAVALLAAAGDRQVKIIAGGQSLMPVLRMRLNAPDVIVDLGRIADLRGVSDEGDSLLIGAMTTHDDVTREPLIRQHAVLLAEAAQTVADPQIRHRGTFGGSIAHADPQGDMGAAALALDAEMVIAGPGGSRTVAGSDFFVDLFQTAVGEDEILTHVRVPKHTGWGANYQKINRTAQSWSIVAVAATVLVQGGTIAQAKVGLTAMGVKPLRAPGVEQALVGAPATADAIRQAAARAAEGTQPLADVNADADYRRHLATVLTGRAVMAATGV